MASIKLKAIMQIGMVVTFSSVLSACAIGIGAAAVGAATTIAGNSNDIGTQLTDGQLEYRIVTNINNAVPDNKIVVNVWDGYTLLAGSVFTEEDKVRAIQSYNLVKGTSKEKLYEYILVREEVNNNRNSFRVSQDLRIKTELSSKLLLAKNIQSLRINTVVSYGRVFLFGIITEEQQKIASDIAKKINGVTGVYTLFK